MSTQRLLDNLPERDRLRVQYSSSSPSLTVKSAAADCDINRILRKYSATGELPNARRGAPTFADVTHLQGDPVALRERRARLAAEAQDGLARDSAAAKEKRDALAAAAKASASSPAPSSGAAPAAPPAS